MSRPLPGAVRLLAACLALACAAPALAREVYECSFPEVANNLGYLPDLVVMSPNPDGATASVVDGIIQSETGGPIEARVATDTDRKITISWTLPLKSTSNEYVKVEYRLSMQKSGLTASLTGRPLNYSNTFSAQGRCTRKQA